jgi:hypothetical protein
VTASLFDPEDRLPASLLPGFTEAWWVAPPEGGLLYRGTVADPVTGETTVAEFDADLALTILSARAE